MRNLVVFAVTTIFFVYGGYAYSNAAVLEKRHPEFPTYFTHANGISVAYQDFGNPEDETILLVMGLGGQLIHWSDEFVMGLVGAGYRVIRFDNRDAGLSEYLMGEDTPGIMTMIRFKLGWDLKAPYKLDDMAADGIALLDQLKIDKAHIAGMSMGGMIAQIMAADYPDRVMTLTSIMSTSGAEHLPQGEFQVEPRKRDDMTRAEIIEEGITMGQVIDGPGDEMSTEGWRALMERTYDRAHYDDGFGRQLWAIIGSGDRVERLKSVQQPTLVIHGKVDPLIPYVAAEHTAELVPNSELILLDDMGHFIAPKHTAVIVDAMIGHISGRPSDKPIATSN